MYKKKRSGFGLLLMILIVVIIGAVMWLDPMSFFQSNDPNLPWNQEFHLVSEGAQVPPTTSQQLSIEKNLELDVKLEKDGTSRGRLGIFIESGGTVGARWSGEFYPEKKVFYDIVNGNLDGNIVPSKMFVDENGIEDPSKLYFLTKGGYFILVSDDNKGTTFQINGFLYARGWIEPDLHAKGELIVSADKKTYKSFPFEGDFKEVDFSSLGF
jgi:hypothetical protein